MALHEEAMSDLSFERIGWAKDADEGDQRIRSDWSWIRRRWSGGRCDPASRWHYTRKRCPIFPLSGSAGRRMPTREISASDLIGVGSEGGGAVVGVTPRLDGITRGSDVRSFL